MGEKDLTIEAFEPESILGGKIRLDLLLLQIKSPNTTEHPQFLQSQEQELLQPIQPEKKKSPPKNSTEERPD